MRACCVVFPPKNRDDHANSWTNFEIPLFEPVTSKAIVY